MCVCVRARARIRLSFVSDIHTRKKEKTPLIFYCSRSGRCSGLSSVDMGEKKDYVPWVNWSWRNGKRPWLSWFSGSDVSVGFI